MMKLAVLTVFAALATMTLFAKDSKEQIFWKWFEENQEVLFHFEKDRDGIFSRLAKALNDVHGDLTFEFGPIRKDGTREFVISAGGIKSAFPSVEALYAVAPKLPKWIILKFRPRRIPINDIEFAGRKVRARDVHYAIFRDEDPKKLGVMLFLDGYSEKEKRSVWGQIGYLFLDEALGEYDVETHVGAIVFFSRESNYFQQARPLSELPAHFDAYLGRKTSSEPASAANGSPPMRSETNRALPTPSPYH